MSSQHQDNEEYEAPLTDPKDILHHRINLDLMKTRLTDYFIKNKIYSYRIVEAPSDYYHKSLDERKQILNVHTNAITRCLKNKNFTCKGYHWGEI